MPDPTVGQSGARRGGVGLSHRSLLGRLFRIWTQWSICVEGTLTWFCSDDVHQRERKLDYELRLPKWAWWPYCRWRGDHEPYYGECIYCGAPTPGRG